MTATESSKTFQNNGERAPAPREVPPAPRSSRATGLSGMFSISSTAFWAIGHPRAQSGRGVRTCMAACRLMVK